MRALTSRLGRDSLGRPLCLYHFPRQLDEELGSTALVATQTVSLVSVVSSKGFLALPRGLRSSGA